VDGGWGGLEEGVSGDLGTRRGSTGATKSNGMGSICHSIADRHEMLIHLLMRDIWITCN
jgi:hypothetical protein